MRNVVVTTHRDFLKTIPAAGIIAPRVLAGASAKWSWSQLEQTTRRHGFGCPRPARGRVPFSATYADANLPFPFPVGGKAADRERGRYLSWPL